MKGVLGHFEESSGVGVQILAGCKGAREGDSVLGL